MSQRRALLLVNPRARQGTAVEAAVARLTAGGIAVRPETFSAGTEAADDIARLATDADLVVIAGGDGTLSRSAGALLKTGLPLGILPTGTANDLARTLEIPTNLVAAADVIVAGRRRRIDVGSVNDCTFFNVATIGLGVDLAHTLDSDLKRRWGRLSYAIAAAKVMMRARPFRAWIRENGTETKVRTLQVAVGNGRFYVRTDAGAQITEANEANNRSEIQTLNITRQDSDLQVSNAVVSPVEGDARSFDLHFTVTNTGVATTHANAWADGVWLSADAAVGAGDLAGPAADLLRARLTGRVPQGIHAGGHVAPPVADHAGRARVRAAGGQELPPHTELTARSPRLGVKPVTPTT